MDTSETYRRILRISAAVMAVVLMFQSGLIDERTTDLYSQTTDYLSAAVGASASVAPTELNMITAELTRQEQMLAAREEAIVEREIAVELNSNAEGSNSRTTYLLTAILFIQLILIVLNYGLDFLRSREQRELIAANQQTSG